MSINESVTTYEHTVVTPWVALSARPFFSR